SVLVLEAGDDVGGRVRTSVVDGYRIDHGFQVLFTAYPTLASYLDMPGLALRKFQPAARVVHDGRVSLIGDAMRDPLRDPGLLLDTVLARAVPLGDKLRLLALRRFAGSLSIDECFSARYDAVTTREFLRARKFSEAVIDGFFAPFYGGIFLDRTLGTSASVLLFTFKMLAEGDTALPAQGIGAITAQLASQLPAGSVRVGVPVASIHSSDGRARGVALADGSHFEAHDVVLATDAPAAAILARTVGLTLPVPSGARGCTTVYYTATRSPLPGRALWLHSDPHAVVSHAVTLTDVAPEYAPIGGATASRMLLAATAVGDAADLDDDALDTGARRDIASMAQASGDRSLTSEPLTRLAVWRVPYAQFAQPPGWREQRPTISCGMPGLWRASEVLHSSSLEGAARGGRDAARVILQQSPIDHHGHPGNHA
ncbi:MAG TPA: FAD-dependent oxidoreductase, partial [Gemmatimonas sp.]|nr:FAD-dependent oxidoreductase [Gemmatimonas sp.]